MPVFSLYSHLIFLVKLFAFSLILMEEFWASQTDFHYLFLNVVNIYSPYAASDRYVLFLIYTLFFLSQGLLPIGGDFSCIDNILDKFNCSVVPSADKISRHAYVRLFT